MIIHVYVNYIAMCFDQVQKKPGKVNEELLSDGTEENDTGFWESLTRYVYIIIIFYNDYS